MKIIEVLEKMDISQEVSISIKSCGLFFVSAPVSSGKLLREINKDPDIKNFYDLEITNISGKSSYICIHV